MLLGLFGGTPSAASRWAARKVIQQLAHRKLLLQASTGRHGNGVFAANGSCAAVASADGSLPLALADDSDEQDAPLAALAAMGANGGQGMPAADKLGKKGLGFSPLSTRSDSHILVSACCCRRCR